MLKKRPTILLFCLLLVSSFYSQDSIFFKSNIVEAAKINEIGQRELLYKRWDDQSGPMLRTDLKNIQSIRLANGRLEIFEEKTAANTPSVSRLGFTGTRFTHNSLYLSEADLYRLITEYPDEERRYELYKLNYEMKRFKKRQYTAMITGGAIAGYSGLFGVLMSLEYPQQKNVALYSGISAATFLVLGYIIYDINKNLRLHKKIELTKYYNGLAQ